MEQQIKVTDVNDIIKKTIAENKTKIINLDAVKGILPTDIIEEKQLIILDIISVLQDIQFKILSFLDKEIWIHEDGRTPEQKARDLLERMEVPNAQDYSAGELVELANLFAK